MLKMESSLLWTDPWRDDLLSNTFLELCSFAKSKAISVSTAISQQLQLHQVFHMPLLVVAHEQLQELNLLLEAIEVEDNNDVWYTCSNSNCYSSSLVSKKLIGEHHVHTMHNWMWSPFANQRTWFF